jgi:outer membrane protein
MTRGWMAVLFALAAVAAQPAAGMAQHQASRLAFTRAEAAGPPAAPLSLDACVAAALAHDARGKAAEQAVAQASARHGQALSARYPSVSARLTASQLDEAPNFIFPASTLAVQASTIQTPSMALTLPANAFGPGFPPVAVQVPVPGSSITIPAQSFEIPPQTVRLMDRRFYSGSLNALYALYTGGLAGARTAQARAGVEASRQDARQTAAEVVFDVRRAYWGIVLAHKLRTVATDTYERMKATLDLTESLYKNGSGRVKKTDYLRHRSMVDTIASMVTEFEAQERSATAALAMLVGWQGLEGPAIADQDFPAVATMPDEAELVATTLAASPQVGQVQAGLIALKANVSAARAGHLPKVGLFADLNLMGGAYHAGLMTSQNRTSWAVGVGVDVPIFQGFRVVKEVQEAEAGYRKLEAQLSSLREGVALDVRRTLIALGKARAQHQSTGSAYRSASENRELNIRAYQDDLVETKDVIEAQLVEAVLAGQFFKVEFDVVDALARLELLRGTAGAGRK